MEKREIIEGLQTLEKSERKYVLEYTRTAEEVGGISQKLIDALKELSKEQRDILAMREYLKIPNIYKQHIEDYYDTPSNLRHDIDSGTADYYNRFSFGYFKGLMKGASNEEISEILFGYHISLNPNKRMPMNPVSDICKELLIEFYIGVGSDIKNKNYDILETRLQKMYVFIYPHNWYHEDIHTRFKIDNT